ncbi:MAG: hypothetical protein H6706_03245 [Myxococcales bacterium]|nr:hypothetical protein [Myxococcales bacterium]
MQRFSGRPALPAADVWLHGASVGDARALAPLVAALRAARPDLRLLYTAWTTGGLAMARQLFGDVPVHPVPISVVWGPRRALAAVRPRLVIWEYLELWPAWVAACRRAGVATMVVDGRVSHRSLRIRPLLARAAASLDAFSARSPGDAERAARLGVRPAALRVDGNGKHDGVAVSPPSPAPDLAAAVGRVDVVVGSLHPDEERAALGALAATGLRALIAPRYPRRAPALLRQAAALGVEAARRTSPRPGAPWVVLDTVGELAAAYALAPVAIVAGSFGRRGGQTLVEPAAHGRPVIYGPATANIAEEAAALAGQGGYPVADWRGLRPGRAPRPGRRRRPGRPSRPSPARRRATSRGPSTCWRRARALRGLRRGRRGGRMM